MTERKVMSFDTMKIDELRQVADSFGVDLEGAKNKAEVVAILAEEGVSYEMYKKFSDAEKEDIEEEVFEEEEIVEVKKTKAKKSSEPTILVKMERKNFTYETYGYTFTYDHPFVAIPENVAQDIFDTEEGFRPATPREVQEYYS